MHLPFEGRRACGDATPMLLSTTFTVTRPALGRKNLIRGTSLQSAGMEHSRCGNNRREVIGDTMDSMGDRGAPQAEGAAGKYASGECRGNGH